MSKVGTCLWFEKDAEAAVGLHVSVVPGSRIDHVQRAPGSWPGGATGAVILVDFTLAGQRFQALNGGTPADYGFAASISVRCADQAEVDRLWAALTAEGGAAIMCGWLRDRWGIPWQIVPDALPRLSADPDPVVAARVFTALQGMVKLDVAPLERAAARAAGVRARLRTRSPAPRSACRGRPWPSRARASGRGSRAPRSRGRAR